MIVDVMIKCPTADIDAVHADITRLTRTLPQYGFALNLLGIHTPLVDNDQWNSPHIGERRRQDCARFDEFIAMLNRNINGFNFCRVVLMDLAKRIGDCFALICTDDALYHRRWLLGDWTISLPTGALGLPQGDHTQCNIFNQAGRAGAAA